MKSPAAIIVYAIVAIVAGAWVIHLIGWWALAIPVGILLLLWYATKIKDAGHSRNPGDHD